MLLINLCLDYHPRTPSFNLFSDHVSPVNCRICFTVHGYTP